MKTTTLRPSDVAVALQLAVVPNSTLEMLAECTCRSIGEVHNAVRRLRLARLLAPGSRRVATDPLVAFIRHGVPYAFPASVGGVAVGVPTAQLMLPAAAGADGWLTAKLQDTEFVWRDGDGSARGQSVPPLYPAAVRLVVVNRPLYELLAWIDLIRVGGARESDGALDAIVGRLSRGLPATTG